MSKLKKTDEPRLNFSSITNFVGVTDRFNGELFKFSPPAKDGSDEGLYCQETKKPFKVRLFERLDREYAERQATKKVITFDEKLSEPLPRELLLLLIGLPYATGLDASANELPPDAPHFPETVSRPRTPVSELLEEARLHGYESK